MVVTFLLTGPFIRTSDTLIFLSSFLSLCIRVCISLSPNPRIFHCACIIHVCRILIIHLVMCRIVRSYGNSFMKNLKLFNLWAAWQARASRSPRPDNKNSTGLNGSRSDLESWESMASYVLRNCTHDILAFRRRNSSEPDHGHHGLLRIITSK